MPGLVVYTYLTIKVSAAVRTPWGQSVELSVSFATLGPTHFVILGMELMSLALALLYSRTLC
jgi:hypothetical protein